MLDELFERKKLESTDLSEHMDTLRAFAMFCDYVTEFGTRGGCSTAALLAGRPKRVISYDIDAFAEFDLFFATAAAEGVQFYFLQQDDCRNRCIGTDLLFIDTVHTYEQLHRELTLHEGAVTRYIILHDTYVLPSPASPENDGAGMRRAVAELVAKGDWRVTAEFKNQNGLTVLGRIRQ